VFPKRPDAVLIFDRPCRSDVATMVLRGGQHLEVRESIVGFYAVAVVHMVTCRNHNAGVGDYKPMRKDCAILARERMPRPPDAEVAVRPGNCRPMPPDVLPLRQRLLAATARATTSDASRRVRAHAIAESLR
jgi:hypothetical protein